MGADDGEEDERPAHRVVLDPYSISSHPVTNAHYASFVRDTGHPVPAVRELPRLVSPSAEANFRELAAAYAWRGGSPPRDRGQHPVALVSYNDAVTYCS